MQVNIVAARHNRNCKSIDALLPLLNIAYELISNHLREAEPDEVVKRDISIVQIVAGWIKLCSDGIRLTPVHQ